MIDESEQYRYMTDTHVVVDKTRVRLRNRGKARVLSRRAAISPSLSHIVLLRVAITQITSTSLKLLVVEISARFPRARRF
jgi:hypothetical protein